MGFLSWATSKGFCLNLKQWDILTISRCSVSSTSFLSLSPHKEMCASSSFIFWPYRKIASLTKILLPWGKSEKKIAVLKKVCLLLLSVTIGWLTVVQGNQHHGQYTHTFLVEDVKPKTNLGKGAKKYRFFMVFYHIGVGGTVGQFRPSCGWIS